MKKKLIGYKLKDEFVRPDIAKAVLAIEGNRCIGTVIGEEKGRIVFYTGTFSHDRGIKLMKDVGMLDVWFEEVYDEALKIGDFIVMDYAHTSEKGWLDAYNQKAVFEVVKGKSSYVSGEYYTIQSCKTGDRGGLYIDYKMANTAQIKAAKIDKRIRVAMENYPVGSKFKDLVHGHIFTVDSHNFDTFANDSQLYVRVKPRKGCTNKTARIYKEGEWAEKFKAPSVRVKGYDAQYKDDGVAFGCRYFSKNFVIELANALEYLDDVDDCDVVKMAEYFKNED